MARSAPAQRLWPLGSEGGQVLPPSACRHWQVQESAGVVLHTLAAQFSVSASIIHPEDVASLPPLCNGMAGAGRRGAPLPVVPRDACRPAKRAGETGRGHPRGSFDCQTGDPAARYA
jgi:hypothetical protein